MATEKLKFKIELYATQNGTINNLEKHGLVYDMKTDMFVPIKE